MYALGVLLITLANVLDIVLGLYQMIIFAAIILSWIRPNPSNDIIRTILLVVARLTNPVFAWVRARMPQSLNNTGLDFSPIIVLLAIFAVRHFFVSVLSHYGAEIAYGLTPTESTGTGGGIQPKY